MQTHVENDCRNSALFTVFDQISGNVLLSLITEKGPSAAKISLRAACGPRSAL